LIEFVFPKVKAALKGEKTQDAADNKMTLTVELRAVPLQTFADCIQIFSNDCKYIFK
jgi:hypothetical protein